ncbi:enoyl-CoA hydratase/isomerase family protein [Paraburkholderia elongata]|uniref:3-hydroxyisobutyryl-CoA hydrolase n=1 Tax=Paraburkholderia elongata TaxID=2675747 RepID=A0A972NYH9_9BURK|nr:enoyl-CoA hydratase/isomerase family protein [Paraburkholderia elongata]NPT62223.1 enoyl-CoA hydratase/isomerase family protein [Paraburkholderia elongata]
MSALQNAAPDVSVEAEREILFRVVNRVAIITLNRPSALNALSHDMVRELTEMIERCRMDREIIAVVMLGTGARGFCAGGDVRALYLAATTGNTDWRRFFIDEYRLDFALHALQKPLVALMDGVTMGGGMGLAQPAFLRVVTERTRIAMPETRIGFIPDVGATHFLGRMEVELELYIGLTGLPLSGADAISCGLADVYAPSASLEGFERRLGMLDQSDIRQSIKDVFVSPMNVAPPSRLEHFLPLIRGHFAPQFSVGQIVDSMEYALHGEMPQPEREWLETTHTALRSNSPLMLEVTREALLRGRQMTLADSFRMEFDLVTRSIEVGDFCEGVRALLVDKDGSPRWMFRDIEDVNPAIVRKFLSAPYRNGAHPLADLGR